MIFRLGIFFCFFLAACSSSKEQTWARQSQAELPKSSAPFNLALDSNQVILFETEFFTQLYGLNASEIRKGAIQSLKAQEFTKENWNLEMQRLDETRGFQARLPVQVPFSRSDTSSKSILWIHDLNIGVDLTRDNLYDWRFSNLSRLENLNPSNLSLVATWSLWDSERQFPLLQGVSEVQNPLRKGLVFNDLQVQMESLLKQIQKEISQGGKFTPVQNKAPYAHYFNSEWLFWTNQTEILTQWCKELRELKSDFGQSQCKIAGELMRNSAFENYIQWLKKNGSFVQNYALLGARDSLVQKYLSEKEDDYLVVQDSNRGYWVFHGGKPYPADFWPMEKALSKLKIWASKAIENKPNLAFKEVARLEPEDFYKTRISLDQHWGIIVGQNFGLGATQNKVVDYRNIQGGSESVDDSSSVWNWLEPNSSTFGVAYQFLWSRFLSAGLAYKQSEYSVKYAAPQYGKIKSWTFSRYEPSAFVSVLWPLVVNKDVEISPYLSLRYAHTFWKENFDGTMPNTQSRFLINPSGTHPTGVGVSSGIHTMFWESFGLSAEAGLEYRGLASDIKFGGKSAEVIGSSFSELYWQTYVYWNFRAFQ